MPYDFKEKAAGGEREQKIIELTRYMMHKHYCENDEEALIERFADPFVWFGTAEHEYAHITPPDQKVEETQTVCTKAPWAKWIVCSRKQNTTSRTSPYIDQ